MPIERLITSTMCMNGLAIFLALLSLLYTMTPNCIRKIKLKARAWLRKIPGSGRGSKQRNLMFYANLIVVIALLIEAVFLDLKGVYGNPLTFAGAALTVHFFVTIAVYTLFAPNVDDEKPAIDPTRLLRDSVTSSLSIITTFALAYRYGGLAQFSNDTNKNLNALDSLYFSLVTFTTLGYGDIAPISFGRAIASLQATLGNLHLAFIVSATFLLLRGRVA